MTFANRFLQLCACTFAFQRAKRTATAQGMVCSAVASIQHSKSCVQGLKSGKVHFGTGDCLGHFVVVSTAGCCLHDASGLAGLIHRPGMQLQWILCKRAPSKGQVQSEHHRHDSLFELPAGQHPGCCLSCRCRMPCSTASHFIHTAELACLQMRALDVGGADGQQFEQLLVGTFETSQLPPSGVQRLQQQPEASSGQDGTLVLEVKPMHVNAPVRQAAGVVATGCHTSSDKWRSAC